MMRNIYFFVSMFLGLVKNQMDNWENKVNYPLRFILYWGFSIYAASIAILFSKLPSGSFEFMLSNMFHPVVAVCLAISVVFSMLAACGLRLAACCLVVAGKIKKTL